MFPTPISWLGMEKPNLTTKDAFTNQNVCTTTQNKHKKLKPGLVASYDIRPANGEGLFLFRHFINLSLTYLDTYPHGARTSGDNGSRFSPAGCPPVTQPSVSKH